jgi:MipA family protein
MRCLFLLLAFLPSLGFSQNSDNPTLLGAGLRSRPAYDGSGSQHGDVVPVIRYYGRTLFARTTQGMLEGGARYQATPGLAVGAQLAYEGGRKTSESELLRARGAPNLEAGASVGLHAEWDTKVGPAPFTLLGRLRQNLDDGRGAQADLRATVGVFQRQSLSLGLFGQSTWANGQYVRTFYGQPGSAAGGGLLHLGAGVLGSVDVGRHWVAVGSLEGRRLQGDAASSPLAERRSNWYGSAGLAYRF